MKYFFLYLLRNRDRQNNQSHQSGFGLVELLVTIVIATAAISALLFLMIEGISANQEEQSLNQVNKDMKQALNFISDDVREAIYVYNGDELISRKQFQGSTGAAIQGVKYFLPTFDNNASPILAFWKVESIPEDQVRNLNCAIFWGPKQQECNALKIERRAYTLVVYLQSTANTSNKWKGESRIERYQLPKYSNVSTLTRTSGYVDPGSESSLQTWPISASGTSLQTATPPKTTTILVDFVASPTTTVSTTPTCPTKDYIRSPQLDNTNKTNSFFACIRNATTAVGTFNQDVILYLKGSAIGKSDRSKIQNAKISYLKSQVLSRGVLSKTVSD